MTSDDSDSDSSSTLPISTPGASGSDVPSATHADDDQASTTAELDTAGKPTSWVEELPPESEPIAVTFPELEPGRGVGPGADQRPRVDVGDERPETRSTVAPSTAPQDAPVTPTLTTPASAPGPSPSTPRAQAQRIGTEEAETEEAETEEAEPVVASNPSFEPPQKVFSPQPTYPEASRRAREQGTVVLEGTISADGYVRSARVRRSASPALDRAALETFRTWQFQPALRDNVPVESSYRLAFRFSLEDPPADLNTPVTTTPDASGGDASGSTPDPDPLPNNSAVAGASAKGTLDDPLPWRGDFTPPSRFVSPLPTYPQSAWATGVQGTVTLEVVVGRDGRVSRVEVLEGLPHGISEAAVEAVQRWRFRPATRDGEPVAVFHRLTLRFAP